MELLIVIAIIIILAGLIFGTSGYVQKKGARSRAQGEIAALSAALESYKADNGVYPESSGLDAKTDLTSDSKYEAGSLVLYIALTGDTNKNRAKDVTETGRSYFNFKPNMLSPTDQTKTVTGIRDPFSNSYGYSTAYAFDLQNAPTATPRGYNPTFDLWSTSGGRETGEPDQTYVARWAKNW